MQLTSQQARDILQNSKILYTQEQINKAITGLAEQIEHEIDSHTDLPIFLNVMNGGTFFTANLLQKIKSPFLLDYIHASRYGDAVYGSTHITWYRQPNIDIIRNRIVYILDDILDEGHTLAEIKRFLLNIGALDCKIAVLIDKNIDKNKPIQADYIGLRAPNHFLFGCGMDIYGLYRQLPSIHIHISDDNKHE